MATRRETSKVSLVSTLAFCLETIFKSQCKKRGKAEHRSLLELKGKDQSRERLGWLEFVLLRPERRNPIHTERVREISIRVCFVFGYMWLEGDCTRLTKEPWTEIRQLMGSSLEEGNCSSYTWEKNFIQNV